MPARKSKSRTMADQIAAELGFAGGPMTDDFEEPLPTPEQQAEWDREFRNLPDVRKLSARMMFEEGFSFDNVLRKAGERDNSIAAARGARQKKVGERKQIIEVLYRNHPKGSLRQVAQRIHLNDVWETNPPRPTAETIRKVLSALRKQ